MTALSPLALFQAGRVAEAEQLLRRHLQRRPQDASAHHLLGLIALQTGRSAAAVQHLQQAVTLEPTQPAYLTNLALAQLGAGQRAAAETALRDAAALTPPFAPAFYNLGLLLKQDQQLAEAETLLRRALAIMPAYGKACYELGTLLAAQPSAEALVWLERATVLEPEDADGWLQYGLCLQESGQVEAGLDAYRRALALDRSLYATVVKCLTGSAHGCFWLSPAALRARLL